MTLFQSAMQFKTAKMAKDLRDMTKKAQDEAARQARTMGVSARPVTSESNSAIMASEVMRTALERIAFRDPREIPGEDIARAALRRVAEINGVRPS